MALIHVIIPVFNAECYLRDAVASVLGQPCQELDLVLVNDGSTDRSARLCNELAAQDQKIHVIHQTHAGVSAARNAGIEYVLSTGEDGWIAFLDADDLWVHGIVTRALCDRLLREKDTDVFAFGGCGADGDVTRFSMPFGYDDLRLEGGNDCIWKMKGSFCANFYRTELLRKWNIHFSPGMKYAEDKIFMLQCVFLARFVQFLPSMLHIYRESDASAMKKVFSIDPIDYYVPIINGWIASDRLLNGYSAQSGRITHAGAILAGIYFMDMGREHFERWHSPSRLYAVYQSHPDYHLFENMDPGSVSPRQYADHNLLLRHPLRYQLRCNAVGAVRYGARWMLRFKPVRLLRRHWKYPLTQIPTGGDDDEKDPLSDP